MDHKVQWEGKVLSVQPRIRLGRSFDERYHSYLGYVLRLRGTFAEEERELTVAMGKGAHEKHRFRTGDHLAGRGLPVEDSRKETADLYRISGLKILTRGEEEPAGGPPFGGIPPALEVYRERGHRRLAARTYATRCEGCIWGCRMAVEMTIDPWKPSVKRYRQETFCYGPKSCPLYRAGPTRKVPGRRGMSYEEEDWIDEDATAHRGPDD
jgi:hypothetical protein